MPSTSAVQVINSMPEYVVLFPTAVPEDKDLFALPVHIRSIYIGLESRSDFAPGSFHRTTALVSGWPLFSCSVGTDKTTLTSHSTL